MTYRTLLTIRHQLLKAKCRAARRLDMREVHRLTDVLHEVTHEMLMRELGW